MESDALALVEPTDLGRLVERTRQSLHDAVPVNTRVAYEGDFRRFAAWCTGAALTAIPAAPETVTLYLQFLADQGLRWSTVKRALAAISTAHVRAGFASPWRHPIVADMRTALRRELGVRPNKKKAADDEVLRRLVAVLRDSLLGMRDRALLTLCWTAARRGSELVAIDVEHLTRSPKGLRLLIPRSKTRHWAKRAGLEWQEYAGHSLRSGFVTTAARRGKDIDSIMLTTGHRSVATVREYIQRETLFERAAGEGLL